MSPQGERVDAQRAIHLLAGIAERFDLTPTEHPDFGGVDPGAHVREPGRISNHYKNLALDITGSARNLKRFNRYVAKRFGSQLSELYYDRGINIKHGKPTEAIGGHPEHVHVAVEPEGWLARPGELSFGGSLPGAKGNPFGWLEDAGGGGIDAIGGGIDLAGEVLDTLSDPEAFLLNAALLVGGAFLVYYGAALMVGIRSPGRAAAGAGAAVETKGAVR